MGEAADVMCGELTAFNDRDVNKIVASFSPDCEKVVPGARMRGGEQVAAWCSALWTAFPDIQVTVTTVIEKDSVAAVRGRVAGTHLGTLRTPSGDIPPTGRRADLGVSEVAEVEGGVMVSAHLYFDRLELLEQLGVTSAVMSA
jgi:predicted ester cyclase